jgi:predicted glycoside hydrolase/deacetylase ChbG (UPF0249 family)
MSREVLFVADDLGMDAKVNAAIVHAHKEGALQAASLMMAQPGTKDAVVQAKANPALKIGWHLHLCDSFPSTWDTWPWGRSPLYAGVRVTLSRDARAMMRREMERQWHQFRETGLDCAFINTHHHLHVHPWIFETLCKVVGNDFKGWIRLGHVQLFKPRWRRVARLVDSYFNRVRRISPWKSSATVWGVDRTFAMKSAEVRAAVATLPDGLHEFIFHPRELACPDTKCLLELKSSPAS